MPTVPGGGDMPADPPAPTETSSHFSTPGGKDPPKPTKLNVTKSNRTIVVIAVSILIIIVVIALVIFAYHKSS
jgi:hypothetical protein